MDSGGPKGKAKGGIARANKLSPEERKAIAKKGAAARWGEVARLPKATHPGLLTIGGQKIEVAVLEDETRVLTRTTFLKAIGRTGKAKGGSEYDEGFKTPVFLTANNLKPFIPDNLDSNSEPILFNLNGKGAIGYRAELLPQVCGIFLDAERAGVLSVMQRHIADRCHLLLKAFSTIGIIALIDEATGYQEIRPRDALQSYLEKFLRKELAIWAKKFPDQFYENIYKLKGWQWNGMSKNRFSVVGTYTVDLVYERLAPGLIQELKERSPKDERGARKNKLHQWLTDDVGHPMLSKHLHQLLIMQELAIANGFGWVKFMRMVDQVLPKKGANLLLPLGDSFPTSP